MPELQTELGGDMPLPMAEEYHPHQTGGAAGHQKQ
jgi:hypothetical protein